MLTSRPLDLLITAAQTGEARFFVAFVILAVAIIEAIALHEYAHAATADLLGDRLPRAMGRLSFNPARHLDPLGTLFIFLVGFGWGRPVEFRPQALSSRRFGAAVVALAGPAMNVALAVASAWLYRFAGPTFVGDFLGTFATLNILLAVLNMIPIPPLDGSRLLTMFLPPSRQNIIFFLDKWGFFILIGLFLFGGFLLAPVFQMATGLVLRIAGF